MLAAIVPAIRNKGSPICTRSAGVANAIHLRVTLARSILKLSSPAHDMPLIITGGVKVKRHDAEAFLDRFPDAAGLRRV
jgi:hypothetical protein